MKSNGNLTETFESSDGKKHTLREMISNQKVVMGCSHAWHRDIFKVFGALHHKVIFEDNALSFRSYLLGDIAYIDDSLVHYRQHDHNITNYSKDLSRAELIRKMARRRQYAVVAIYQRLLDIITYKELCPKNEKRAAVINKMLMTQLAKQNFKMNLAARAPSLDRMRTILRNLLATAIK